MRGITKRFPGIVANDHVDFELRRGEVHALLGENGAGKSTLMNILYGLYEPGRGRDRRATGSPSRSRSASDAIDAGIGMVHQHFMLIPVMTVAENVVLGGEPRNAASCSTRRRAEERVRDISKRFKFAVDPERARRGHRRRPAAARRDHEGALPQRRHPDPRRADRRADAPGGRRAVRDPPRAAAREGISIIFITPQARRGARDRRPDHGAPPRQADRHRPAGGGDRGRRSPG